MSKLTRALTTAAVALGLLVMFAPAASAAELVVSPTQFVDADSGSTEAYEDSQYLPINRWSGVSLHSKLDPWNPFYAANASAMRGFASMTIVGGNQAWSMVSDWTNAATSMDVLSGSLGYQVDRIAGLLGSALAAAPLLYAAVVVVMIVLILWRSMRSRGRWPWAKLAQSAVVIALITVLSAQASAGTASVSNPDNYQPKFGSPVWIAKSLTGAIDLVASSAVDPVLAGIRTISDEASVQEDASWWACPALANASMDVARDRAAGGSTVRPGTLAVTNVVNTLWLSTSPPTYSSVQFGGSNPYAQYVWCRQLERTAAVYGYTRGTLYAYAFTDGTTGLTPSAIGVSSWTAPIVKSSSNNDVNDRVLMALAACQPDDYTASSFSVRSGWREDKNGNAWVTPEACKAIWTAADDAGVMSSTAAAAAFDIGPTDGDIFNKTSDDRVIDYIQAVHGSNAGAIYGGLTASAFYFIGALFSLAVFGGLALAVFGAKLFMLLSLVGLFLVLILALFRTQSFGEQMAPAATRFMGLAVFSFGASAVIAFVGVMSLLIAQIAYGFAEPGTLPFLFWVSVSPLLAVLAVHFIFTKLIRMPSPFTVKGALAWGLAGGAVGGAVAGAAMGALNRGERMAKGTAGRAGRGMGRGVLNAIKPGLGDRALPARGAGAPARRKGGGDVLQAGGATGAAQQEGNAADAKGQKQEVRQARRDARRAWREQNPGGLTRVRSGVDALRGRWAQARDDRVEALRAAEAAGSTSHRGRHAELLTDSSRATLGLTNADGFAEFGGADNWLVSPDQEIPPPSSLGAATWNDLSPAGKRAANRALREKNRANATPVAERVRSAASSAGSAARDAVRNPVSTGRRAVESVRAVNQAMLDRAASPGGAAAVLGAGVGASAVSASPIPAIVAGAVVARQVRRRSRERKDFEGKYVEAQPQNNRTSNPDADSAGERPE